MSVLWLVVVPWLAVSVLAAGLLAVAGLRRDKARTAKTSGTEPEREGEALKRSVPELIHSSEKR